MIKQTIELHRYQGSPPIFASNIKRIYANWLTYIPPEIIKKTYGFLVVSGVIEVNWFVEIYIILEAKFGDNP